jgi:squalene-hopene/tetraprenyl-beta-curcumene cyclase
MRRSIVQLGALAMVLSSFLNAQDVASIWQGTFTSGREQRRAVLQMSKNNSGGWQPTAYYLEFLHDDLHIDSFSQHGSNLKFTINGGKGSFTGKISADGSMIDATWTIDGRSAPVELRRTSKETAWRTPFLYQYHLNDVTYLRPSPDEPRIPFSPKLAYEYMEQGAVAWTAEWKCVACHTNGSYMVVRPLLTPQFGQPQKELRDFFVSELKDYSAVDPAKLQSEVEPTQVVYIAAGLAIWDANVLHHLSPETVQALTLMFKMQRDTGDWYIEDDNNPPLESSPYQLATVAARAIGNAPGWLTQIRGTSVEDNVNRLENFLRAERKLQGDYDRTDLLWASTELPGLLDSAQQNQLIQMIFSHQRPDGGWSIRNFALPEEWGKGNRAEKLRAELEFPDPPSDGHMTGLAIIALRKAGVPASDPRIQRGISWLLTNQRSSGRWWTRSLNRDNWQFISYSSTAYPLLALSLCNALPPSSLASGHIAGNSETAPSSQPGH